MYELENLKALLDRLKDRRQLTRAQWITLISSQFPGKYGDAGSGTA